MKTIVPTDCIMVAGLTFRQWRKLYRNKINMFGQNWTEHVYEFTPACKPLSSPEEIGDPYEIRVYEDEIGGIIWATGRAGTFGCNDLSPHLNAGVNGKDYWDFLSGNHVGPWIGEKGGWKRTLTDVKFLLSHPATREDFIGEKAKYRREYLMFPTAEVESAVWAAVSRAESGRRLRIGSYSGPASLSLDELRTLGVRVHHRPPGKDQKAPGDYVHENFNWGCREPRVGEWFLYGAGYHYHGTVGCNAGNVWYDGR